MDLLVYLLKSAVVLALFYLVYITLLRRDTHFKVHRVFLLLGVVAAFILPLLYFTTTVYIDPPQIMATTALSEIPSESINVIGASDSWWTWPNIFLLLYCIGLTILLGRFGIQLHSLIRLLRNNPCHYRNGFHFIKVSDRLAPFSFFNYIVYNPRLHSESELEMILKHEQAHAFQWHTVDILLANILVILQWPNPFAWLYKKSVEENLEFLADDTTIAEVPSRKEYQIALLKVTSSRQIPALTTNFDKSFIKKRIIMLNKQSSKQYNVLKVVAILPCIAIFLWGFNLRETVAYNEVPQTPESEQPAKPQAEQLSQDETDSNLIAKTQTATAASTSSSEIAMASVKPKTNAQARSSSNPEIRKTPNFNAIGKDFKATITKNTTDAELEEMKRTLKRDFDIDFSYSTTRNSKNEITSINIQYQGDGRSGNFSETEDDAIGDFVFYLNDSGKSGFYSEKHEERMAERMLHRAERMKDREKEREEIIIRRDEKRKEMREDMEKERKAIREEMKQVRKKIKEKDGSVMIIEEEEIDDEGESREFVHAMRARDNAMRERERANESRITVVRDRDNRRAERSRMARHNLVIDKNMSDAALEELKNDLTDEGIQIDFSKIRRNKRGELTRIKVTVETENSKQTMVAEGEGGEPINVLRMAID